jgi:hypothetical protein
MNSVGHRSPADVTDTCAINSGRHRSFGHVAAGATWKLVTASAPWAARYGHTSVIDAAGAIFVIGGGSSSYYNDAWMSTDGGADRALGATILCVAKPKFEIRALSATWLNPFRHVVQIEVALRRLQSSRFVANAVF